MKLPSPGRFTLRVYCQVPLNHWLLGITVLGMLSKLGCINIIHKFDIKYKMVKLRWDIRAGLQSYNYLLLLVNKS